MRQSLLAIGLVLVLGACGSPEEPDPETTQGASGAQANTGTGEAGNATSGSGASSGSPSDSSAKGGSGATSGSASSSGASGGSATSGNTNGGSGATGGNTNGGSATSGSGASSGSATSGSGATTGSNNGGTGASNATAGTSAMAGSGGSGGEPRCDLSCASGERCELMEVQCVRAPCPPQPTCVPAAAISCDPAKILCRRAPPQCPTFQAPSVEGSCYGPCVPIDRCPCKQMSECPNHNEFTCHMSAGRCGPYV